MKISELIAALQKYPPDYNARAYEGEVCGIIIEDERARDVGVIEAHESDAYTEECWERRFAAS